MRLTKWLALVMLVFLMLGCKPWWDVEDDYDPIFSEIPHPFFYPASAASPVAICNWMCANIHYVSDDIHDMSEYWQSPDQTFVWRSGDCEDFAILGMYLIRQEVGGWPQLVVGDAYGERHGWIEYEGRWYEPQTGTDVTNNPYYVKDEYISYGIAIWRSSYTHRSMMREE